MSSSEEPAAPTVINIPLPAPKEDPDWEGVLTGLLYGLLENQWRNAHRNASRMVDMISAMSSSKIATWQDAIKKTYAVDVCHICKTLSVENVEVYQHMELLADTVFSFVLCKASRDGHPYVILDLKCMDTQHCTFTLAHFERK